MSISSDFLFFSTLHIKSKQVILLLLNGQTPLATNRKLQKKTKKKQKKVNY